MDHSSPLTRRRVLSGAALVAGAPLAQAQVDGRGQPVLLRRPFQPSDGADERNYFLYLPAFASSRFGWSHMQKKPDACAPGFVC